MKRILGMAVVVGLVGALTVMAQEVKPGKVDVVDLGKDVKLEMVLVPAGKFKMGFTKKELAELELAFQKTFSRDPKKELGNEERDYVHVIMSHQGKQHEVTLTKPFYMGKYEVTQEQWKAVMGDNPSKIKGGKLPVTNISWEDCHEFIKKLNKKTNGEYRLPSEAEWEFACRAGTTTAYSFGDNLTKRDANISGDSIKEVGSYKPNAFGLYDMHGNVYEWCEDREGEYPTGSVTDPKGPFPGITRETRRGGSFIHSVSFARSSLRGDGSVPTLRTDFNGFRLARTP